MRESRQASLVFWWNRALLDPALDRKAPNLIPARNLDAYKPPESMRRKKLLIIGVLAYAVQIGAITVVDDPGPDKRGRTGHALISQMPAISKIVLRNLSGRFRDRSIGDC